MVTEGDAKLDKLKHIIKVQKEAISEVKRKSKRKISDTKLDELTRISAIKKGAALKIAETALKDVEEGTPAEALAEDSAAPDESAEHTAALADTAPPAPAETTPATPTKAAPAEQHTAPEQPVSSPPEAPSEDNASEMVAGEEGTEVVEGEGGTKTSGLAIVALIFAFIFPLLGLILGLAAMAKIKKEPTMTGRGLAITATVIGAVLTLAAITLIVLQITGIYVLI